MEVKRKGIRVFHVRMEVLKREDLEVNLDKSSLRHVTCILEDILKRPENIEELVRLLIEKIDEKLNELSIEEEKIRKEYESKLREIQDKIRKLQEFRELLLSYLTSIES